MMPPVPADAMPRAVEIARGCDAAVVVVGTRRRLGDRGRRPQALRPARPAERADRRRRRREPAHDRGPERGLAARHAVARPRRRRALHVWFGGQETGNALADVLFGDADPGGRLPTTVPRRLEDTPAYLNYPGEHGKVHYGEGVFGGHRSYDARGVEPLFPFGFGLSYTRFELGEPTVRVDEGAGDAGDVRVHVALDVTNAGTRAGQEVVQLYVADRRVEPSRARPASSARSPSWHSRPASESASSGRSAPKPSRSGTRRSARGPPRPATTSSASAVTRAISPCAPARRWRTTTRAAPIAHWETDPCPTCASASPTSAAHARCGR